MKTVEQGIILEDDCLANNDFFYFCEELLERYKNDSEIFLIAGSNFQKDVNISPNSYYFSRYMHCWGWATWKRAWEKYDNSMAIWPAMKSEKVLDSLLDNKSQVKYWSDIFDRTYNNEINSWGYVWMCTCWWHNALTIIPKVNLVINIGFGDGATHTKNNSKNVALSSGKYIFH